MNVMQIACVDDEVVWLFVLFVLFVLIIHFSVFAAVDPRILRTSVTSFYDFLLLASETVDQFGT
jgi:hypothetical protein